MADIQPVFNDLVARHLAALSRIEQLEALLAEAKNVQRISDKEATDAELLKNLKTVVMEFVSTINNTGGVRKSNFREVPAVCPIWGDLGAAYMHACAVLNLSPEREASE